MKNEYEYQIVTPRCTVNDIRCGKLFSILAFVFQIFVIAYTLCDGAVGNSDLTSLFRFPLYIFDVDIISVDTVDDRFLALVNAYILSAFSIYMFVRNIKAFNDPKKTKMSKTKYFAFYYILLHIQVSYVICQLMNENTLIGTAITTFIYYLSYPIVLILGLDLLLSIIVCVSKRRLCILSAIIVLIMCITFYISMWYSVIMFASSRSYNMCSYLFFAPALIFTLLAQTYVLKISTEEIPIRKPYVSKLQDESVVKKDKFEYTAPAHTKEFFDMDDKINSDN